MDLGGLPKFESLLRYDAETGKLYWLERTPAMFANYEHPEGRCATFNKQFAGKEALTAINKGYRCGRIYNRMFQAHRVAYRLAHGRWPNGHIDHIDGNPLNNRADNLRDVSNAENHKNERRPKSNTSGVAGVGFISRTGRWRAHIKLNYRQIHLGTFASKEEAVAARRQAEREHGFHENHGRAC